MQISKIRLTGFKSFVDPTELMILDGLTGVVGPNGCGKSNLLEALRWVMGENRPKAIRGDGMEDVIFAGAASRPARNYGEVMLTLDNRDRLAPAAFNDADTLEVIRRVTRDAGSAYKANGKDIRTRDVQMLFADASTGAHSPALVRQGQIGELVNAKPKDRRRVLEEAAGISGLYQRRHEAELKLNGAEANLARVDDVVEQLDTQLASLARQVRQAVRYRLILDELRQSEGLLLYRRWREADVALERAVGQLHGATELAAGKQAAAARAEAMRMELAQKVPPLRETEAAHGVILQRLRTEQDMLGERENQARMAMDTLRARIEQLGNDSDRETGLSRDAQQMVSLLGAEQEAIGKSSEGQDELIKVAETQAHAAAVAMQEKEAEFGRHNEDVALLAARHQSAHRLLVDAKAEHTKYEEQVGSADQSVAEARDGLSQAEERLIQTNTDHAVAQAAALQAETDLGTIEAQRTQDQAMDSEARGALSEAEGEANALNAEAGALERVIARDQSSGVQVLDEVRADKGYESALGASLSDDLKAPVIGPDGVSGWALLPEYSGMAALPPGAEPLAGHVTAPDVLARRLGQTGVVARKDGARLQSDLHPGQRLVSVDGDLWRWDGFRASAQDAPSAAALRLQQVNRLDELREAQGTAAAIADRAQAAFQSVHARLQATIAAEQDARQARKIADETLNNAMRELSRAEAERDMFTGRVATMTQVSVRLQQGVLAASGAVERAEVGVRELGDLDAARNLIEALKVAVEAARITMLTKRTIFDEQRREGEARTVRRQEIPKETAGWQHRLQTAGARIAELEVRKESSEIELGKVTVAPEEINAKREELGHQIEKVGVQMKDAGDVLAVAETELRQADQGERDAERSASEAREARARADAMADAARALVETAANRIGEELECSAEQLLEQLETTPDDMPAAAAVESDVARLRRQRDTLGAVNLRAEEDARDVSAERDALASEQKDLDEAIKKLRSGIAGLNKEGRERLLAAFDEVNSNFSMLFKHLFDGGDAHLELVESDDPLQAGLEIMCQPPGKKLSALSLLSGGEKTLTALSLIFAVFLANPSPICVLDEVDAPLDDSNVVRFCGLLDEMIRRTDTRFLIITHHAVTMSRMDRLYGVTMAELGVSQLVSVDLREAERMVG